MKILHTADWHIGKILHKHSLEAELQAFFQWLIGIINDEGIDLLLISGDIFDIANAKASDRAVYFHFLKELIETKVKVIITGGNHDSIQLLNAPSEVLNLLDITIIGGATENIKDELIPIKNEEGEIVLVIAAVPFLRDKDLRNINSEEKYNNRTEAVGAGIKKHYAELADICEKKYKGTPVIAMGHLYAKGSISSDSEREIQVGNAAAIESSIFLNTYKYVALGHIHRPQLVGGNSHIRYSGSPIALSFSEKKDHKQVIIIEMDSQGQMFPRQILVPKVRELKKISGNFLQVEEKLKLYNPDYPLKSFVEIDIQEINYNPVLLTKIQALVDQYQDNEKFAILKHSITFENGAKDTSELYELGTNIEDLKPIDVFMKRLELEEVDKSTSQKLSDAFIEILELIQNENE